MISALSQFSASAISCRARELGEYHSALYSGMRISFCISTFVSSGATGNVGPQNVLSVSHAISTCWILFSRRYR